VAPDVLILKRLDLPTLIHGLAPTNLMPLLAVSRVAPLYATS
jgi:hypothetical protein